MMAFSLKLQSSPCAQSHHHIVFNCGAKSNTIQSSKLPATKLGVCTGLRVQHKISNQLSSLQGTPLEMARVESYSCGSQGRITQMATPLNSVSTLNLNHSYIYSKQRASSDNKNDVVINSRTDFGSFVDASKAGNVVPVWQTIDLHLTSHEALQCMANRTSRPSEIFLEVVGHGRNHDAGIFTILNAPPSVEILAESVYVTLLEHKFDSRRKEVDEGARRTDVTSEDLMADVLRVASAWQPAMTLKAFEGSPQQKQIPSGAFCGGWVDLVTRRDSEESWNDEVREKIYEDPVRHMGLVDEVVVIDHNANKVHMVHWVHTDDFTTPALAYNDAIVHLQDLSTGLVHATHSNHMQGRGSVHRRLISKPEHLSQITTASSPVTVDLAEKSWVHIPSGYSFPQSVVLAFDAMVQLELSNRGELVLSERALGAKFTGGYAIGGNLSISLLFMLRSMFQSKLQSELQSLLQSMLESMLQFVNQSTDRALGLLLEHGLKHGLIPFYIMASMGFFHASGRR